MLIFMISEDDRAAAADHRAERYHGAWMAYVGAVHQAGISRAGHGLQPPETATTVRVRGDARQVQDGPFADTKEQIGGYFVIEVEDLDAALEWAARAPCAATGGVEVRPVMPVPPSV
ncbi:YciI family protein [Pseudacidovorax intermedius]